MEVSISRSPRYPRISLLEAVQFAQRLYDGVHKSPVDAETAFRMMGFAGKNGSSATALGALRQFGLVDGQRGDLRISDLSMRIFEPSSRQEYANALQSASENPGAFQAIKNQFSGSVPRSDEPIRSFLIRTLDFSKAGADDCIKSLRRTLNDIDTALPVIRQTDNLSDGDSHIVEARSMGAEKTNATMMSQLSATQTSDTARFMLTKNCAVTLNFEGVVSAKALERLIQHIQLMHSAIDESE